MTKLIDPVDNATTFAFDNLNRLTSEANHLGAARTYQYDLVGNLTELTDRNGRVRQFAYDRLDRRTQELWLDGANVVNTIDYTYDDADRLLSAADDFSAYGYTYDHLGRPVQVDNAETPGAPNVVLTRTYDNAGRRTGLSAALN